MTTDPDISIIIVNWNTRDLLIDCLAALPWALGSLHADIWVVDNHSHDGSIAAVQHHFPHVHLIQNQRNIGFAAANNQAIQKSRGRSLLLLNSDTIATPRSLEELARFLDQHTSVGIVGACLLNPDGTLQPSWAAFPTLMSELPGINRRTRRVFTTYNGSPVFSVDWVGGACLLIRRDLIHQIGPLDEQFFMYSEEADWCYRARRCGWHVCYLPTAQVIHLGGQSSRQNSLAMKQHLYRSKLRFFAKHYGHRRTGWLALLLTLSFLARAGVRQMLTILKQPDMSAITSAPFPPSETLALIRTIGWEWLGLTSTKV